MATKITSKQIKVISNVNFNNKEIENAIIDATKNNIKNVEEINKVDDVLVNGESVVENKIANISVPTKTSDLTNNSGYITNAVDNLMNYPTTTTVQAADTELQEQINQLQSRGRFLSLWDCITGLAESEPTVAPYEYKTGDYFIVGNIGITNYRPFGSSYTPTEPSTVIETGDVQINDTYVYDGSTWLLQENHNKEMGFSEIVGSPYDNTALGNALNSKQDTLVSGTNIKTINGKSILGTGDLEIQGGSNLNEFVITQEIFDEYKNENDYADLADIIDSEEITQNVINLNNFNYFLTGLVVSNKTLLFKNGTIVLGTSGINDSINNAITSSNCKLGFIDCEIIVNDSMTTEPEKPIIDLNNTDLTFDNVIADNFTFTTFKTFIQTTNTCNIVLKDTLFDIIDKLINYDPEEDEKRPSMKFIKVLTNGSSVKFINSMVDISTENLIGEDINPGLCQNIIVETIGLVTVKLEILNSILQLHAEGGHGEGGISSRPARCLDVNLDNLDVKIINSLLDHEAWQRTESSYGLEPNKSFTTNDPYMVFFKPDIDIFQGDDEAEDYEPKFENINIDKYLFVNTVEYIEGDYHFTYNGSGWDVTANSFDEDDTITRTLDTNITIEQIEEKYGLTFDLIEGKVLEQGDDITLELVLDSSYYKILENFTAESNSEEYLNQLDYYIEETVIPEDEQEIIDTVNYNRQTFANGLAAILERNGLHLKPHTEYDEDTDTETPVMAKIGFWYDEDNDDPNVWKIEIDSEWIEEDEHLMDDVNIVEEFGLEVVLHEGQIIPNLAGFTVIVEPLIEKTKIYIKEIINSMLPGGCYNTDEDFPNLEEDDQPNGIFSGKEPKGFSQFEDIKVTNIKSQSLITTSEKYYLPVRNENLESDNVKDAINELADKGTLSEKNAGFSISIHGDYGRSGDKIYYDGLDIQCDGWNIGDGCMFGPGNEIDFNDTPVNATEGSLIFRNGQLLDLDDYTIDNNLVTFNEELQEGDIVAIINGWTIFKKITGFTGTELEIDFNFEQRVLVFKNGILLSQNSEEENDYYYDDGKLIFTTELKEDDKLVFVRINGIVKRKEYNGGETQIFIDRNDILLFRDGILQGQNFEDEEGQLPENYDYVIKDNPSYHEDGLISNAEFMNDDKIELESETTLTNKTDVDSINAISMFYGGGFYYFVIGNGTNTVVKRSDNINGENLEDVVNVGEELNPENSYSLVVCNCIERDNEIYFMFYFTDDSFGSDYTLLYDKDWNLVMKYISNEDIMPYIFGSNAVFGKNEYSNKIFIPSVVYDFNDPEGSMSSVRLIIYDIDSENYEVILKSLSDSSFNSMSTQTSFYDNKIWISTSSQVISIDLDNNYNIFINTELIPSNSTGFITGMTYVKSSIIDEEETIDTLYFIYSDTTNQNSFFKILRYNDDNVWEEVYYDEGITNEYSYATDVKDYNEKTIISTGNNIYISRNLNDIESLYQINNAGDLIINDNILSVKGTVNSDGYSYFDIQTQATEPITPLDENERIIFIAVDDLISEEEIDKILIKITKYEQEDDEPITIFEKRLSEFEDYEHEEEGPNILYYIQVKDLDINELLPEGNYSFTLEGIYEDEEDEELFRIEFNTSLEDGNIIFNIEPYSINEPYMIQFQDALDNCNLTILDKGISGGIFNTLSDKQDKLTEQQLNNINNPYKPLIFNNIEANEWQVDDTFEDYGYKCELECEGVNENMFAQVVFSVEEANSGNYASVCDTAENKVIIYSKVNDTITIPTIVIMEA